MNGNLHLQAVNARRQEWDLELINRLRDVAVIPVVEIDDVSRAEPLATTLAGAGLPCLEVTFRTTAAADAIRAIRDAVPDVLVGAGTILTAEDAEQAVDAGAAFLVAPALDAAISRHAAALDVPFMPGVCTPSEINAARSMGHRLLKLFPTQPIGGVAYVRAVSAPFRDVLFVPTGGIHADELADYLALRQVIACGGSWIAPAEKISAGEFGAISDAARDAVARAQTARMRNIPSRT